MSNQPTTSRPILIDRPQAFEILRKLETFRLQCQALQVGSADYAVRICQSITANVAGLPLRSMWENKAATSPIHEALNRTETFRESLPIDAPVDHAIRVCQADVAVLSGFEQRGDWVHVLSDQVRADLNGRVGPIYAL